MKTLNLKLFTGVLVTALFSVSSYALADEANIIGKKVIQLDEGRGKAMITTLKTDAKWGRPYTMELQVKCRVQERQEWKTIPVSDRESVCDVKPQSPALTANGKHIAVMIRETDADAVNEKSKNMSPEEFGKIDPICKKTGKEFLFSVEQYCK